MVPKGFKDTRGVGFIPEEWGLLLADEICLKISKGTTPPKSEIVEDNITPFLRVNNLSFNGQLDRKSNFQFVSQESHNGFLARSKAYPGDILMNIVGPPLGKIALLDDLYPEYNMNQAIVFYRLDQNIVSKDFFVSFLCGVYAQQWLQSRSKKTSGQQNLTIQLCKELPVPIPSIPEQKKIAQILSTWDKAIDTSEKLLANSRQQKKALMQQLLTGKKRLRDKNGVRFSESWHDTYLTDASQIIVSPVDKKIIPGEIPVELCNYTDVYYNNQITRKLSFMKATAKKSEIEKYILEKGDVIITKDSETPGDIAVPALVAEDLGGVVCGYHLAIIRPNRKFLHGPFLSQLLSTPQMRYYFFTLASGATRFGLSVGGINKAHFKLPNLIEQKAIANVLSNADREIETLQQKLDGLKQEKKALMQQLLTGKRRVQIGEVQ
ncbi:restriction endonuclease subunit S [Microbulbifer sp. ANSA005]|uniref:restriction endonuclease subunit S n=1 Tax=Microbulbifer sp. ANSA005 TaxID=3243362 RepID=UPI004041BC85